MIETCQGKGVRGNQTQEKEGDGVAGANLYSGDMVAINVGFKLHHVGGSSSVHQALIQHMMHPLQLPLPTKDQYVRISDRSPFGMSARYMPAEWAHCMCFWQ